MRERKLIIVESPTKANTIKKFLDKSFIVESCIGHIRDLPNSAKEIPQELKKFKWASISIDYENGFKPIYIIPQSKKKVIEKLKKLSREVSEVYLATDEDREGESISWHLREVLELKNYKRMVFHEITKKAILSALENTREIDMNLVRAQEARRVLDRLYGFTLSPLIWKKIAFGLSAGRVQSVGLKLLIEKEESRIEFKSASYYSIALEIEREKIKLKTELKKIKERAVAEGKDFLNETGKLKSDSKAIILTHDLALKIEKDLQNAQLKLEKREERRFKVAAPKPFITSTMQQELNKRLGISTKQAMLYAQKLYENGFITYIRTDSYNLSSEAINKTHSIIKNLYGEDFISLEKRVYKKSSLAQEAHEAIRPAGDFIAPHEAKIASSIERAIYKIIWDRTIASQMRDAERETIKLTFKHKDYEFRSSYTKTIYQGFLRHLGEEDEEIKLNLDLLSLEDLFNIAKIESEKHETKAPARYTEASLVQKLEKEGIGRPSTYATIISTLIERKYIYKEGTSLIPTATGKIVIDLLKKYFPILIELDFTSKMEENLDKISIGSLEKNEYLNNFYNGERGLKANVEKIEPEIDSLEFKTIYEYKSDGLNYKVNIGKFGPYIVVEGKNYSIEITTALERLYNPLEIKKIIETKEEPPKVLGIDPKTKLEVIYKVGRYGPIIQLGSDDENTKPKVVQVKNIERDKLDLALALKILSLPRNLGEYSEIREDLIATTGIFGDYIKTSKSNLMYSIKPPLSSYEITLEEAINIIKKREERDGKIVKKIESSGKVKTIYVYEKDKRFYAKIGRKKVNLPENAKLKDINKEYIFSLI